MDIPTITAAITAIRAASDLTSFIINSNVSLKDAEAKLKLAGIITNLAEAKMAIAGTQQEILGSGSV